MGQVFTALFAFLTQLFSAAEKTASSLNNLATWADEASGTFTDEARHNRNMRVQAMMKEQGIDALPKEPVKALKNKLAAPVKVEA